MWSLCTNYIIGKGYVAPVEEIIDRCGSLQWTDDSDTLAVSLTFESVLDLAEGRSHLVLQKDNKIVFQGVIVNKINKDKTSSYTAMDYAFYLNKNEDIIQFNDLNAKDSIYALLGRQGVGGACTTLSTKINKFYKGKAVSDIIKDILDQCKLELGEDVVMEMRGSVLWIDRVSNFKKLDNCKFIMGTDFSVTRSMEDMVNYVDVVTNEESDKASYSHANDDNSIKIFGKLRKVISIEKGNESQAQNTANNYLYNYNGTKREITCTLVDISNCENIRAKRSIYLDIPRYGVEGYYKIKSAQHSLSNGIHKINLAVDFSCATFQDPPGLNSSGSSSSSSSGSDASSKAGQIIAYAKTFLGVPYVSGGKGPYSFDCSGFVAYVFNHFGYNIDSYTYTMINQGTSVSKSDLQPCDMVFFFNTEHVGMYIGNDQFIQSPHTGDVVKISQFSGYYEENCNAVTRVL